MIRAHQAPSRQELDAMRSAQLERTERQQAQQRAQQQADAAERGVLVVPPSPDGPPTNLRVQRPDGKIISIGPEGVIVSNTGQPLPPSTTTIPKDAVFISLAFFATVLLIIIGLPISRAIARRMDRRTAAPAHQPVNQGEQLRRIEQAVDALSVEMERISENQRFVTKLLSNGDGTVPARVDVGRMPEPVRAAPRGES